MIFPTFSSAFSCVPSYLLACFLARILQEGFGPPRYLHPSAPEAPDGRIHLAIPSLPPHEPSYLPCLQKKEKVSPFFRGYPSFSWEGRSYANGVVSTPPRRIHLPEKPCTGSPSLLLLLFTWVACTGLQKKRSTCTHPFFSLAEFRSVGYTLPPFPPRSHHFLRLLRPPYYKKKLLVLDLLLLLLCTSPFPPGILGKYSL